MRVPQANVFRGNADPQLITRPRSKTEDDTEKRDSVEHAGQNGSELCAARRRTKPKRKPGSVCLALSWESGERVLCAAIIIVDCIDRDSRDPGIHSRCRA